MGIEKWRLVFFALVGLCLFSTKLQADNPQPVISIIIDDLGYSRSLAEQALQLPLAVTLSILPFGPYSQKISQWASDQGREYMLHLPMQGRAEYNTDPGMLTIAMSDDEFINSLKNNLQALSGYSGVNNHKGSELTADPTKMQLLLKILSGEESIFIVDSKTTATSKISAFAREFRVPFGVRNIFLDVDKSELAIKIQFDRLLSIARKSGSAIAIGHPYPITLALLGNFLADSEGTEFQLVTVRQLIAQQHQTPPTVTSSLRTFSPVSK